MSKTRPVRRTSPGLSGGHKQEGGMGCKEEGGAMGDWADSNGTMVRGISYKKGVVKKSFRSS